MNRRFRQAQAPHNGLSRNVAWGQGFGPPDEQKRRRSAQDRRIAEYCKSPDSRLLRLNADAFPKALLNLSQRVLCATRQRCLILFCGGAPVNPTFCQVTFARRRPTSYWGYEVALVADRRVSVFGTHPRSETRIRCGVGQSQCFRLDSSLGGIFGRFRSPQLDQLAAEGPHHDGI
jgi:hypothetical protein